MKVRRRYKAEAYEEAKNLRMKGFSYAAIARVCGISPSTVHAWFASESFSQAVKLRNQARALKENKSRLLIINRARQKERSIQYDAVLKAAATEFKHYRSSPLFMAGLMIYLSEGDNRHPRLIRLANARPDLHRIFLRFMKEFMGVERAQIRFWLLLYPDLDEATCMRHWMKKAGLSVSQFYKNQYINGRSKQRTLHFGVGNTIIGSTLLKKKLLRWIDLATKELEK
jgi:transcriptional regulator with XRE-family HTH domain